MRIVCNHSAGIIRDVLHTVVDRILCTVLYLYVSTLETREFRPRRVEVGAGLYRYGEVTQHGKLMSWPCDGAVVLSRTRGCCWNLITAL